MKRLIERVAIRNQFYENSIHFCCFPKDHILLAIKPRVMADMPSYVRPTNRVFRQDILRRYNQLLFADLINKHCYMSGFHTYTMFIAHQLSKADAAKVEDQSMLNNREYQKLPPHPTDPHGPYIP